MPTWWGKKSKSSSRKKEEQGQKAATFKERQEPKSFDDLLPPLNNCNTNLFLFRNRDLLPSSGSESDGVLEKQGHPLPRPSPFFSTDHGSVSSDSSSGSSEDAAPDLAYGAHYRYSDSPTTSTPRGRSLRPDSQRQQHSVENRNHSSSSPIPEHSRLPDISFSPRSEIYGPSTPNESTLCSPRASMDFNPRSRSPGAGLRVQPFPTSSSRNNCFSPGCSTEKQEDARTECHPLPLPPSSPSSPTLRNNGTIDNGTRSKWMKGKLLGRGTFGHVYVGFNSGNGQMCAIKEVKVISDDQNSKESLRQLNQEISVLSQLSHPNIVQYYGSELTEDTLSVFLEYVSGGSIHKLLQDYGPFMEPVIQNYTVQILSGLAYLHERNTLHRDIKGANILVDPNGGIKLADFGMAKHTASCTSVLSFKGSPYWMAPEVIMNFNGYNRAVDIWSLGCTIIEMATSKPPWSQYEGVAAIFKIGNSKDIPDIPDHFSDDGKNFLTLCLQRDPAARPTAKQLLEHPFVRSQATFNVPRFVGNEHGLQSSADDIHIQDMNRRNFPSHNGDLGRRFTTGLPAISNSDQIALRANLSLPVSPCSSPLRRFGPAHSSCFLSPPPGYVARLDVPHGAVTRPVSPSWASTNANTDPRQDFSLRRAQTPNTSRSPRRRNVLNL